MIKNVLLFLMLTVFNLSFSQKEITVSGTVVDANSGETLIGVTVYSINAGIGTATNSYGFYSLTLPTDTLTVNFSFIGYETLSFKISSDNMKMFSEVKLHELSNELSEVTITANDPEQNALYSTQGNMMELPVKKITELPGVLGETDIIKTMQLMPGINPGGEGGSNFFVRGGEADQNLVILDEATVYNVGHLIGFFSVFNTDAVKDVKIYKGGFPAQYGGRLSSVIDVKMKEGNMNAYHGNLSVGLLASKFSLEGPIIKNKASFLISARRTYIDQVFKLINFPLPYYFYDLNAKLNYKINHKNRIYIASYFGDDILKIDTTSGFVSQDTVTDGQIIDPRFGFKLGNRTATLRWNHLYNSKLFSNISLIYNRFLYDANASDGINNLQIGSKIEDFTFKTDFDYSMNAKHSMKFGVLFTHHTFFPNMLFSEGEISEVIQSKDTMKLTSSEGAFYFSDDLKLGKKLKVNIGVRSSFATADSAFYGGFEPRISANYLRNSFVSVKFGYSRMYQYIHRVSSSNFVLPTDMYYPITKNVKPLYSDQIFLSYTKKYSEKKLLLTIELYQKWSENLIEFKEGSKVFLDNHFEDKLVRGKGRSSGIEFMLNKNEGNVTGWISYTLAVSKRQFPDINDNQTFYAKNDRRHNFSVVSIFKINKKWNFSASWVYMSGNRFTPIIGQYLMPNATNTSIEVIPIFAEKNTVVMSPVHRLDVSFNYKPYVGKKKKLKSEWQIGFYNLYNRAAPYIMQIVYDERGFYQYTQPGLFGRIFSLAYNLKF